MSICRFKNLACLFANSARRIDSRELVAIKDRFGLELFAVDCSETLPDLICDNAAGVIATADTKTGNAGWKLRVTGPFSGSPVGSGKHLVAVCEKGLLQIVDTTGEGSVVGSLQLPLKKDPDELVLSTPALSGGKIFVRADSALWKVGQ